MGKTALYVETRGLRHFDAVLMLRQFDAEEAALASHGSPLVAVLNAFTLGSSIPLLHPAPSHPSSPANPAQTDPQEQLPTSAAKAFP